MNPRIVELREVIQKLVPLLAGKGLVVTQRGARAYVTCDTRTRKPTSVNIPMIPENSDDDFIFAIQGFIDHEVGHVLLTDWNYYGGAPTAQELRDPKVQAFQNTHNIVEDTMIEREIVKIFPGSKRNIARLREHFIERITKPAVAGAKDAKEQFMYLLVPVMRALSGHVEFQEYLDKEKLWENIYVKALLESFSKQFLSDLQTCKTTKETLELAKELHAILYPPPPPAPSAAETGDMSAAFDQDKSEEDEDGESEDKPEQKAGEGDGDGERDHEDLEESDEDEADEDQAGKGEKADDESDPADEEDGDDEGEKADSEEDEGSDLDETEEDEADETNGDGDKNPEQDGEDDDQDDDADTDGDGDSAEDGDDKGSDGDDPNEADSEGADSGDVSGDGDDEDDGDEGSESSGDVSDEGDAEGESDGEGASGEASGTVKNEVDMENLDNGEESEHGDIHGVGSSAAKSMFDFDEDAFDGADISSKVSQLISETVEGDFVDSKEYVVYTRECDRIEPLQVPEKMNAKWVPDMEQEVASMTGQMQKDIERMMASQSHVLRTPGHRRGKLHAPSLYRVTQGDPRVFSQKEEHVSKDTAVTLLIDNSGSMSGAKMKLAMIAGYALSATLDRVKITHEVLGFTTGGYYDMPQSLLEAMQEEMSKSSIRYERVTPIIMPIYKSFDERMSPLVKKRIAYAMNAQNGLNGNIDGESLEYAAERLVKRQEKRKVMLVLSDGQPAGGSKCQPHLRSVIKSMEEKLKIETIGIGIMDASVSRFYPKHVVLNNAQDLPGQVMTEIKKLLV